MYLLTEDVGLKKKQKHKTTSIWKKLGAARLLNRQVNCWRYLILIHWALGESFINLLCFQGLYSLLPSGPLPSRIELGEILA